MISDTVKIYLRESISPHMIVDSTSGLLNNSGSGTFSFSKADNATGYFIVLRHRNSVETWSSGVNMFTVNKLDYDFSLNQASAFGNNLVLKGSKYCIYSGDVIQDGAVDASDLSIVENSVLNSGNGYISSDLNGDNTSDAADLSIVENNIFKGVTVVRP